ncbi:hypothetical protein C7271_03025 [filamentous cyanobacterium CCP5]|nr:hypothetical protein C7271_03025 [filamentous cyanobacterium CCP5]
MARSAGKLSWDKSELLALSLSLIAISSFGWLSRERLFSVARGFATKPVLVVITGQSSKEHTVYNSSLQTSDLAVAGRSPASPAINFPRFTLLAHGERTSRDRLLPWLGRRTPETASIQVPAPVQPEIVPSSSPLTGPIVFSDVKSDYWARSVLDGLSERGLISGFPDGTFQPDRPITRLELAVQLAKVFHLAKQPVQGFQDIPADHWAQDSIHAAAQMGFFRGGFDHQFLPDASISKAELLVAIASGLRFSPSSDAHHSLQQFRDHDQVPAWAVPQIAAAVEAGIVVNYPDLDHLGPQAAVTRSEAAVVIYQSLVYLGKIHDLELPYRVPSPGW